MRTKNKAFGPRADEGRIRSPFHFWLDDSWNRTVRHAGENPWLHSCTIWIPLFILVALFKLIKFELLATTSTSAMVERTISTVMVDIGGLPIMLAGAGFLAGLAVQSRFSYRGFVLLPVSVVATIGLAAAVRAALIFPPDWISLDYLLLLRQDLVSAAAAIAVSALVIVATRGLPRRLFLVVLQVVALVVAWLCGFDFGYFVQTGSMADSYLLRYSFAHWWDLHYAVGNELDAASIGVLILPILFSTIPVFVANRPNARRRVHVHSYSWRMKRGVVLSGLFGILGFVDIGATTPSEYALLEKSVPVELIGNFVALPPDAVDDARFDGIWPSTDIAFHPTDSTDYPNIVFVIIESTRAAYSNGVQPETVRPVFEDLRMKSLSVEDLSVVVPHTNKALVPLLCGVYPEIRQNISRSVTRSCLPTLLTPLGYDTAFFTPANLEFEQKGTLLQSMGFEEIVGADGLDETGFSRTNYFGFEDDIILKPAVDWMTERLDAGIPFFSTLLTLSSHHDYQVPGSWPIRQLSENPAYNRYLNTQAYQDSFLGSLIAEFERRGALESTIFVVVSDHGEAFSEHGLQFHSAVPYQEVIAIPGLVFAPGRIHPGIVTGPRQQMDLVPTVADLLNVDYDSLQFAGRSLLKVADRNRSLFMSGWIENQSMVYRVGSMKYVYHFRRRPIEVFDLDADPFEETDVASSMASDSLLAVERRLLSWRRFVNERYQDR